MPDQRSLPVRVLDHPASYVAHGLLALAGLFYFGYLVATWVPFAIKQLKSSYLIFFFHFPNALNTFVFFGGCLGGSVLFLITKQPRWDRWARCSAEVGVMAGFVLLATGMTWAKAAWDHWWVWDDPRLMSAAVMMLTYLGYLTLQAGIEDPHKRRTFSAVFGVLAFLNIPIVHKAIEWFGETSHPPKLDGLSDPSIIATRWFGVLVFLILYLLLLRWRQSRLTTTEEIEDALDRIRRLEEAPR